MGLNRLLQTLVVFSMLTSASVKPEEPIAIPRVAQPELTWCLDHFPRFHNYEDLAEPNGPSVDVMRELAKRVGYTLRFTPRTPISRCFRLMQDGTVDLMSNLKYSEQRNQLMTLLPYASTVAESLFLLRQDKRAISSFNQLKNLTVASIRGYLFSPSTMQYLAKNRAHIAEVESIEAGLEMLNRGRVDALIAPTVSTSEAIFSISSYDNRFRIATLKMGSDRQDNINIGLSRTSAHAELLPQIQHHLKKMRQDGTIKRLYSDKVINPEIERLKDNSW